MRLNLKPKRAKSLFFSKGEAWWLIGFSMIISGGMLTVPQIITSFILEGNLEGMWIIWAGFVGGAFGVSFFPHLWKRLPVKTENELILFRFSGIGAKTLHIFRSLYVGGLIAPLGLSLAFIAFGRILAFTIGCSVSHGILISLAFILITTFFNSLRQRIRLDTFYLAVIVVSLGVLVYFILKNIGSLGALQSHIAQSEIEYRLIPKIGTTAFTAFLVFFLVQWWSASIIDFPDISGQKFMSASSMTTITKSIVLPSLIFSIFTLIIYTIPFFILLTDSSLFANLNGEEAFLQIFLYSMPKQLYFIVVIFFLLPFIAAVNNTQNWSGSLLVQNFYLHYINSKPNEKKLKRIGTLIMLGVAVLAAVIALMNESMLDIIKFLFTITAGVGPVFILRWYWHRINAWSQFSAMVASLIYPNLYDIAYSKGAVFANALNSTMTYLNIDYYPLKIVILTIFVCTTWILITYLTKPTDPKTINQFSQAVKPGGIWNNKGKGKIRFWKRFSAAMLFVGANISFYSAFWYLLKGWYAMFLVVIIFYTIFTLIAYAVLKRVNEEKCQE